MVLPVIDSSASGPTPLAKEVQNSPTFEMRPLVLQELHLEVSNASTSAPDPFSVSKATNHHVVNPLAH